MLEGHSLRRARVRPYYVPGTPPRATWAAPALHDVRDAVRAGGLRRGRARRGHHRVRLQHAQRPVRGVDRRPPQEGCGHLRQAAAPWAAMRAPGGRPSQAASPLLPPGQPASTSFMAQAGAGVRRVGGRPAARRRAVKGGT